MYVKDMPSVAAASCREERLDRQGRDVRMDEEDSVLDGVIDDRIAAAYAIVELGERDSKKVTEFASSELDEELEAEDLDQYHQVPRSPEYCRKDRRCKYDNDRGSADSSPSRRSLADSSNAPRLVGHVRGAVMPSRISRKPEPKTFPKRSLDLEEGSGIKAKLARMLFKKKGSRTDLLDISPQDDEKEIGVGYKGAVDSDEERPVESQGGRFVRTSMSLLEPANVVSCTQSPAGYGQQKENRENLEVRLEQSYSAEEINRLRESLLRHQSNEDAAQTKNLRQNASQAGYGVSPYPGYCSSSTTPEDTSTTDLVIPVSSSPAAAFPNTPQALSSGDDDLRSFSQVPPQIGAGEYYLRESAPLVSVPSSWPIISGGLTTPYLFRGPTVASTLNSTARLGNGSKACEPTVVKTLVPGTGFVQYFVLPTTNPASHSANLSSSVTEPMKVKQDVDDDAMTKLENFTMGKQAYIVCPSRPEPTLSDTRTPYWCLTQQARGFYPRFGSLNSISNYYSLTSSPSSEAGLCPSSSALSRSCHDLTRIPSKSPKFQDIPNDFPCQQSPDVKYRRPKSNESAQASGTRRAQRACKNRRKISPSACALEMVRGGGFGSLGALRKFYGGLKSRSAPNLTEKSLKKMQSAVLTGRDSSQNYGEVAQDFPLDLSSYRRRFSTETKQCPPELQSFSICKTSVKVDTDFSTWQRDSCAQTASDERLSDVAFSQERKANVVGAAVENGANPSLSSNSLSNVLPNSSLPPKKRRLRQPSQSRDISEVKTTTSAGSTMAYLRQADSKPDSDALRVTQSEELVASRAETELVLTAEMKLLENKVGVRDEDGDLPLHIAVAKGHLQFVQKVLLPMMSQHGVHIDSCNHQRQTALHLAVITNQPQMVEMLLNASASASVCDRKGNTAVHLAVKYRTPTCLRYILANSRIQLDLDAKNYEGLTALHLGVQLGETETVKTLLANGADPNAMDGTNGRTPLFYAVETNDYVMASVLLKHGSNPCIASYSGCSPLQIATAKSFRDMTNMLERSFPRGFASSADQEECFVQHV